MADDESRVGIPGDELTAEVGPPDPTVMREIRDRFLDREPLVETADFDDPLHPRELAVEFQDGIGAADGCRLDVTWFRSGAYRFHYVDDEGVDWRLDRHPNPHSPEKHFHGPPDASAHSAVESCIDVEEPRLVALAVLKLWRRAYESGDFDALNEASDPP